jgi:hypothetical protein
MNSGNAVVRYDQFANRWFVVLPMFRRLPARPDAPMPGHAGEPAHMNVPAVAGQPGSAAKLNVLPPGQPTKPKQNTGPSFRTTRAPRVMEPWTKGT